MSDLYEDVKRFIDYELTTRLNIRDYTELDPRIRKKLQNKSDSMYIMVTCQVDRLCSNTSSSLKDVFKLLDSLPGQVEAAYSSMRENIPSEVRTRASKIMAFALYAIRPMSLRK